MSYVGSTQRRLPVARPSPELPAMVERSTSAEPGFFEAACDREAITYFAKNVWSAAIFSWTFYLLALASSGDDDRLPFASVTYFTLFLVFVSRTGFVPCPNLAATAGVLGLFTVLGFWITVASEGRVAAFGDAPNMLFIDLTAHLAIPLDAFVRPYLLGYYTSLLGIWYTLFFALAMLGYMLVLPEPYYPFMRTLSDAALYGLYFGSIAAVLCLHAAIVAVARRVGPTMSD
jgi:hypothetical protein